MNKFRSGSRNSGIPHFTVSPKGTHIQYNCNRLTSCWTQQLYMCIVNLCVSPDIQSRKVPSHFLYKSSIPLSVRLAILFNYNLGTFTIVVSGVAMTDPDEWPAEFHPTLSMVWVIARPPAKFSSTSDFTLWSQRFELYLLDANIPEDKGVWELVSLLKDMSPLELSANSA